MAGLQRILLVEDSPELRGMYKEFLTLNHFTVATAVDGEDALVVAKQFKPDLVFLDIMMPKKDGYAVLKLLRHDPAYNCTSAKIVILTNLGDSKANAKQHKDMDGYVIKANIMLNDLLDVIKSLDTPAHK